MGHQGLVTSELQSQCVVCAKDFTGAIIKGTSQIFVAAATHVLLGRALLDVLTPHCSSFQ